MNLTRHITVLLLTLCAVNAQAGYISGTHTLSNGKTVALQDLEWMPLTYTAGLSRLDIEDGFTDRFGGAWESTDWRYATRSETEMLLGSLWGGTHSGWHPNNSIGANWFLQTFGAIAFDTGYGHERVDNKWNPTWYKNLDSAFFMFGDDGECDAQDDLACLGYVHIYDDYDGIEEAQNALTGKWEITHKPGWGGAGFFEDTVGLNVGLHDYNEIIEKSNAGRELGSLLVRRKEDTKPSPVPAPNSLILVVFAIVGLVSKSLLKPVK